MGWYFKKSDIRNSPSIQKGLPLEVEERYRREGVQFIIDLKLRMGLSLSTMATAAIYFHRFYMVQTFQEFPRYAMACACVFLAGKVEETPKKCKDLVLCSKELLPEERFVQFGTDVKNAVENLMTLEKILLQKMKFQMEFAHPYEFIMKYSGSLKGSSERKLGKMQQMAWKIAHDSWCTTLCLQWESEIIAVAVIYLACKLSKFEVTDWENRTEKHVNWWDQFLEDLSIDLLDYICHQILDHYALPMVHAKHLPMAHLPIIPVPPQHLKMYPHPVHLMQMQMLAMTPSPSQSESHSSNPTPKMFPYPVEYPPPHLVNFPGMHAWPGCIDFNPEKYK